MMNQLALHIVDKARTERVVVTQTLENGMKLLAYPADTGVVLGVGYDADLSHRVQVDNVLRIRGGNPARYGRWLPTLFMDSSCYVVTRIVSNSAETDQAILSNLDLKIAQELMA